MCWLAHIYRGGQPPKKKFNAVSFSFFFLSLAYLFLSLLPSPFPFSCPFLLFSSFSSFPSLAWLSHPGKSSRSCCPFPNLISENDSEIADSDVETSPLIPEWANQTDNPAFFQNLDIPTFLRKLGSSRPRQ